MDRCWLITWTCYGHWLPGDARGFVGNVRDKTGGQVVHNIPGTPYDANMPRLEHWVRTQMKGRPVTLGRPEAEAMIAQYQETARIRQWAVQAASVIKAEIFSFAKGVRFVNNIFSPFFSFAIIRIWLCSL